MSDSLQRKHILDSVQAGLADGSLSFGAAIVRLRKEVTGLKQADFARMCKISMSTLCQLEKDDSNPTVQTLNAVFKPFGMQVGIVPRRR